MKQLAPDPKPLFDLVKRLTYKPHWSFVLKDTDRHQGSVGLTLTISIVNPDTNNFDDTILVDHYMIVPPAAYDARTWRRWLFDQILLVEQHEAAEFFRIDGSQPYAPNHGPGNDPYTIRELATEEDRRTTFLGEVV